MPENKADHVASFIDFLWCGYQDILTDGQAIERSHQVNCDGAFVLYLWKYNQEVEIAIGTRITTRLGTEEDDSQRIKLACDKLNCLG